MNKFTLVRENINLGRFVVSEDQLKYYSSVVNRINREVNKGSIFYKGDLEFVYAFPNEKRTGRDFSIVNKINSNRKLMREFVYNFNLRSFEELIEFIDTERDNIFKEGGKYFSLVWDTIRYTEKIGELNEILASNYIKNLTKLKYGLDIEPKREVTSSYKDLILGIDITFSINNKELTCQVKPLKSYNQLGENIKIYSSGSTKIYNVDYMAFTMLYEPYELLRGDVMLFRAKNMKVLDERNNTYIIPKSDLVNFN